MPEKKKMSVAEILAAARKADSKGGDAAPAAKSEELPESPAAEPVGESSPAAAEASEATPAPKAPVKATAPGERPNVKDILAMARAGGKGPAAAAKPAAPKPAAAAAKPA